MSLRKTFKTNREAELNGVWVAVAENEHNKKPIEICISRMSRVNTRYSKALEEKTRVHQSAISNDSLDEAIGGKLLRETFAESVLLNWRNLPKSELTGVETDTEELAFSPESALALFEEMPDLYEDWSERARKASAFREKEKESNAKN